MDPVVMYRKMSLYDCGQHQNQTDYIIAAKEGEALYSQQKQDQQLTMAQIMNSYCEIQS